MITRLGEVCCLWGRSSGLLKLWVLMTGRFRGRVSAAAEVAFVQDVGAEDLQKHGRADINTAAAPNLQRRAVGCACGASRRRHMGAQVTIWERPRPADGELSDLLVCLSIFTRTCLLTAQGCCDSQ